MVNIIHNIKTNGFELENRTNDIDWESIKIIIPYAVQKFLVTKLGKKSFNLKP